MKDTLRDSAFGYASRQIVGSRTLCYPDEASHFDPLKYFSKSKSALDEIAVIERRSKEQDVQSSSITINGTALRLPTTPDIVTIVDWYGDDDPENPQNWSNFKKYFVGLLIWYAYLRLTGLKI